MAVRKWIKNLSALLLVVSIAGLAGFAIDRARKSQTKVLGLNPAETLGEYVAEYTGFEYMESIDGELIFALNSIRTLGLSSGWHEIEGVRLQFYDHGDEGPVLTCETASFNTQTHDARLSQGIHVDFPDGGFLNTDQGSFDAASRRFETEGSVTFVGKGTFGHAGKAVYAIGGDRLELSGGVMVRSDDGGVLNAPRITYSRNQGRIAFPDGCRVQLHGTTVDAARAVLMLEETDGVPVRASFFDGVSVTNASDRNFGIFEGHAERIRATRDPSDNWQVEASTSGQWIELLFLGGETFIRRSLLTQSVRGVTGPEGVLNLRAEKGVCLEDYPNVGSPRGGEARAARLWFDQGQATDVELDREVVLQGEGVEARGHRARFSVAGGLVMVHGNPTGPERALLISERGRVRCDQVHLFQEEGRTEARGNVQGQITDVALLGGDPSNTEPMHFAGAVLEVAEDGTTFILRENARAWQGHQLLLADEVRYQQEGESLRAVGHVRTTIPAAMMDPDSEAGEDVVVVARSLDYGRGIRQAVYRGNVRYSDPDHMLSASELTVHFDETNEVTTILAVGAVEIVDLVSGQKVTGQEATRDVRTKTVYLTGTPAQAMDAKGNVVRGRSLTWDQASGSVTVAGDTETVYFPEDEP